MDLIGKEMGTARLIEELEKRCEVLERENAALLTQRVADERDLFESTVYSSKLQDEIRQLKKRNERLYQIMDSNSDLLRARTTALCALLSLPAPGKLPPPYEVET